MVDRLKRCRPLLGTFVEVTADCEAAIEAGYEAVAKAHTLMSAHEADSDVGRINRLAHQQPVQVDPWTAAVLERAIFWSRHSEGVFDVVRAGRQAIERGLLPLHPDQPPPQARHWTWLELQGQSVRLLREGAVDLGGIAKGYAVDRAIAAMKEAGAGFGLVNAGGDMAGFGPQPWPVQVVRPDTRCAIANIAISNGAVATSSLLPGGGAEHLPGKQAGIVSATVCAPSAMDADALTKIVLSGSPIAAKCLAIAGAQAFTARADGSIHAVEARLEAA